MVLEQCLVHYSEVKVVQSCPTLCNSMDYTVCGILQARTLEWVAFPFSRGSFQPRDWTQVSHIAGRFFTTWATREAQEYWSGYPILSPADLLNPGIKPGSPALQVDSLPTELSGKPKYHPLSYSIITLNKIYKTMVLRHWIIGRTVILREWKQRKWVLPMSQLTIWREFPGYHTHGTPEE